MLTFLVVSKLFDHNRFSLLYYTLYSCSVGDCNGQVSFMKSVEHLAWVLLEHCGEHRVGIALITLVDVRNGDGTAVALGAGSCLLTSHIVSALTGYGLASVSHNVDHFAWFPVLEGCMGGGVVGHPVFRVGNNLLHNTILIVFLLHGIEEQIDTGEVAESCIFCNRSALFGSQRLE